MAKHWFQIYIYRKESTNKSSTPIQLETTTNLSKKEVREKLKKKYPTSKYKIIIN